MICIYMNKKCPLCNISKLIECFSKNITRKDGFSGHCKDCHKKLRKEHYELNKEKIIKQVYKQQNNYLEWLDSLKVDSCYDCKKIFPPYVMDFDHVRGKKSFNISLTRKYFWSKKTVLKEIEKCDLICSNCHRERTHQRLKNNAPLA